MAEPYDISVHVSSDVGCHRTINEDSVLSVQPHDPDVLHRKGVLVVVADGMGGHSAGEVASRLAVDAIHERYYRDQESDSALADAFQHANRTIYETAQRDTEMAGMGTTCTAVVVRGDGAQCAHVGDTRLYLVRQSQMYQLTEDHSAVRQMVAQGLLSASDAEHHADRNVILRALGTHKTVDVTTWPEPFPVRAGDHFLLCSDGLHDLVEDDEIKTLVLNERGQAACEQMVALARSRGGYDNITVALIHISSPGDRPRIAAETRTLEVPA